MQKFIYPLHYTLTLSRRPVYCRHEPSLFPFLRSQQCNVSQQNDAKMSKKILSFYAGNHFNSTKKLIGLQKIFGAPPQTPCTTIYFYPWNGPKNWRCGELCLLPLYMSIKTNDKSRILISKPIHRSRVIKYFTNDRAESRRVHTLKNLKIIGFFCYKLVLQKIRLLKFISRIKIPLINFYAIIFIIKILKLHL